MRRPIPRPSAAMVVACIALLVALGGTSYATVLNVPRNSVGTPQLKRNAVKPAKLAPNAVRGAHVLNGSLLAADFKAGQLPAGPRGEKGEKGDSGPPGMSGHEIVTSAVVNVPKGGGDYYSGRTVTAQCPGGKTAVGGGYYVGSINDAIVVTHSRPTAAKTGWEAYVYNGSATPKAARAYVICVNVS